MVRQSQASFLLTRPLAQSQRFAHGLIGDVVISPLMQPEFLRPKIAQKPYAAMIFTSETGVMAAAGLRVSLPKRAFCVGKRTALAAQAQGWQAVSADGNAADLAALILAQNLKGPLLLLQAQEAATSLRDALISAGLEPVLAQVYRQKPLPLTPQAVALLQGTAPVLLPLFSPRSAKLFCAEYRRIVGSAPVFVAAISLAVLAELDIPAQGVAVAQQPDAASLRQALAQVTQQALGS